MPGVIIPHSPVAIDYWYVRSKPRLKLFFLSHCHGDHMEGLNSSWSAPLFCSPLTARLTPCFTGVDAKWLRPLELGREYKLPIDEQNPNGPIVSVTLIEAFHCPGAVMFVLDGYFGRVVYSGDFRFEVPVRRDLQNDLLGSESSSQESVATRCSNGLKRVELPEEWEILTREPIDLLYLDTTYWDCQDVFPRRDEAKAKAVRICQQNPDSLIIVVIRRLGKEDLLSEIATALNEQICVSAKRIEVMRLSDQPEVFTLDREARIRAVELENVSQVYNDLSLLEPTIMIIPSALHLLKGNFMAQMRNDPNVYLIPYSDHCSRHELNEFLSCLPPLKRIEPIVKIRNNNDLKEFCCVGSPPKQVVTPTLVKTIAYRQTNSIQRNRVAPSKAKAPGLKFIRTPNGSPSKSSGESRTKAADSSKGGPSAAIVFTSHNENEDGSSDVEILYEIKPTDKPKRRRIELIP